MEREGLNNFEVFEKSKFSLDHIHKILSQSLKIKKRVQRLNKMFNKNIEKLNLLSNEIKCEAVSKTNFSKRILKLMKISQIQSTKDKFQFLRNKKLFSQILKSMGKNVMRELFLMNKVETLTKSEFRRYIAKKVKSYLSYKYVDFDNASQIHLFEQLKKNILRELNICNDIILENEEISTENNSNLRSNQTEVDNFIVGNNLSIIKRRHNPIKLKQSKEPEKDEKSVSLNYNMCNETNKDNESLCNTYFTSPNLDNNNNITESLVEETRSYLFKELIENLNEEKLKSLSVDINNELNLCANSNTRHRSILEILKEKLLVYSNVPNTQEASLENNFSLPKKQCHRKEIFHVKVNKKAFLDNIKKKKASKYCNKKKASKKIFIVQTIKKKNNKNYNFQEDKEQNLAYLEIETS